MSQRVSRYVILCEDRMHASVVGSYLIICGVDERQCRRITASDIVHGGNIGWVLDRFRVELLAARQRQARAETLLIVVADADALTVEGRERGFRDRATFADHDPVAILIPKRHMETWVCAANGQAVDEEEDCKRYKPGRAEIRRAARQIHDWARNPPPDGSTCVPSLRAALPRWRRIG